MKNDRRRSTNESARGKIASHACAVYEDIEFLSLFFICKTNLRTELKKSFSIKIFEVV